MDAHEVIAGTIWEGVTPHLMARVLDGEAAAITQAGVSAIAWEVWDVDDSSGPTKIDDGTLTVADVVYDSLQNDARWQAAVGDGTGYNFRWACPAANFAIGGRTYWVEVELTGTGGVSVPLVFEVLAKDRHSR